ncbi:LOW QUALITY PROTEIN: hypothetical protein ACHAXR_009505 [Thalassiosira sp. AJA248-18]
MPSAKKKKGRVGRQPPRAAAGAASSNPEAPRVAGGRRRRPVQPMQFERYLACFRSLPPSRIVDGIRRGAYFPTHAVLAGFSKSDCEEIDFLRRLVDEGMVGAVLNLLGRCENQGFEEVMDSVRGGKEGGDLAFPSVWVTVLVKVTFSDSLPDTNMVDKVRLEIAGSIAPLVRSMVNGDKREFFKSNHFWHRCKHHFFALVHNLVGTKATVDIIFQYEGLVDMLVQSMFWQVHRMDIVEEANLYGTFVTNDVFSMIEQFAGYVVLAFADVEHEGAFNEVERERIDFLARTSIVSKAYCSERCDTFAVGLTLLIKLNSSVDVNHILRVINQFTFVGCVDARVIEGLVECGDSINFEDAGLYIKTMCSMMMPWTPDCISAAPNDSRYAIAIDSGLFEMCLDMVIRHDSMLDGSALVSCMTELLQQASSVAILNKSSKAIRRRCKELSERAQMAARLCESPGSQGVVKKIQAILQLSAGSEEGTGVSVTCCLTCHRKELVGDGAIKNCGKCKRATYCSRECLYETLGDTYTRTYWRSPFISHRCYVNAIEVAHWPAHKRECKYMLTQAKEAQMTGCSKRDVKQAKANEKNVSMIGNKTFRKNFRFIMIRAVLEQKDILDCVVKIDLTEAPPSIELQPAAQYLSEYAELDLEEDYDHASRIVERNRERGAITCACRSLGGWGGSKRKIMLNAFFGDTVMHGSWQAYQNHIQATMPDELEIYKHDKELREQFLAANMERMSAS